MVRRESVTRAFKRPVLQPSHEFEWIIGSDEPGAAHHLAHETSWALLDRVRSVADPQVVDRVVRVASGPGIDDVAELWAGESTHSLAGVLWRLYLLRRVVESDPEGAADMFRRGSSMAVTIDPVVAGAAEPVGPETVAALCDTILRGAFTGDLAAVLDRAVSYCKLMSLGAADLADSRDEHHDADAGELTTRALRYATLAEELASGASRWRLGTLM